MNCKGVIFFTGCVAVLFFSGCSHKETVETITERTKTAVSIVTPEGQDFIDYIKFPFSANDFTFGASALD